MMAPIRAPRRQSMNPASANTRDGLVRLTYRVRGAKVIDCLKGLSPSQIDGKDDAKVTVTIGGQPQELAGQNYLYHFAQLQGQFHATTAYDILRSVGVPIGKIDYLGPRPR